MALSPELTRLIDAAENALLNCRQQLSDFSAATKGTPQKISADDFQALSDRARLQPWSLSEREKEILETATGPTSFSQLAAQIPAPRSAWTPSPDVVAHANKFSSVDSQRRAASHYAEHKPVTKDKSYYRGRWNSGDVGRQECTEHAAAMKLTMGQYRSWLWKDEPIKARPGAPLSHQQWAEKVLRSA